MVETPAQGVLAAKASPLTAARPMRSPVKLPGTVGHGVQIQLGGGQAAGFQGGIHHGQQGLAVGQPGVGSHLI